MRKAFYAILIILLLVAMSKGIAFKITVDGEPRIIEVAIGLIVDKEDTAHKEVH